MTTHLCVSCGNAYEWEPHRGRPSNACSPECRQRRHTQKNEESRQRAIARGCPDDKHGTSTGYTHFRCTCARCRKWASEYQKARRAKTS